MEIFFFFLLGKKKNNSTEILKIIILSHNLKHGHVYDLFYSTLTFKFYCFFLTFSSFISSLKFSFHLSITRVEPKNTFLFISFSPPDTFLQMLANVYVLQDYGPSCLKKNMLFLKLLLF